ncbi:MAG: M20/M25/M40 family metallo-hydrolase [Rhodothermaceae bacterium]|nr:M20/M25/M40 family metallo-hydrolase [Rhodothermaceae bacterium]
MAEDPLNTRPSSFQERTLGLVEELIRQDTSNPPGNEYRAARPLMRFLLNEGLDVELIESSRSRSSVVARMRGVSASAGPPGLLLSHLDVSPVQRSFWSTSPFTPTVQSGYLWGRGAIDLKTLVAAHAVGLAEFARHNPSPHIDVMLLAAADETRGGKAGIRAIEEHRSDILDCAWVLGEGSFSYPTLLGSKDPVFTYCPQEKTALWLVVEAQGAGGHSSVPRESTAVTRLVGALAAIGSIQSPRHAGHIQEEFIEVMMRASESDRSRVETAIAESPAFSAMFTDTVSITIVEAGMEPSVVPSAAKATLDCRLLPDTDPSQFIADLEAVIAEFGVSVTETFRAVSGASDPRGFVPRALERALAATVPGAAMVPVVSAGYTDLRIFRARNIPAYGCHTAPITLEDRATIAGHDERVPIRSLGIAAEVIFNFLGEVNADAAKAA